MILQGRAWIFGDDVPNDDGVMPLEMTRKQIYDPELLAAHCFSQINDRFADDVKPGDIVFGGKNFAFGNAHIQGFLGLKGCGVGLVVKSMPRSAIRSCVNSGVPLLVFDYNFEDWVKEREMVLVDFKTGQVVNKHSSATLLGKPLPEMMLDIIECGGGLNFMHKMLDSN